MHFSLCFAHKAPQTAALKAVPLYKNNWDKKKDKVREKLSFSSI
jgi:hypothetical protein